MSKEKFNENKTDNRRKKNTARAMDDVASLNSWTPSRTLAQPTSKFESASDGVRLGTGRVIGQNISLEKKFARPTLNLNLTLGGQGTSAVGGGGPALVMTLRETEYWEK